MKVRTASAKNLSSSSSDFMLQAYAFLPYFPAFIITCSNAGRKHHKTGSFMVLQFLDSRNSTRNYHKKNYQKTISCTFQSHKWIFCAPGKATTEQKYGCQEVGLYWSLSEHLLLVMLCLLMSKTKQGFVCFLEEGGSHGMKIHKHAVHRVQPSSPHYSGIN